MNNPLLKPATPLTAAEHERLSVLVEECAEVIKTAGKILRHGYESVNPLLPKFDQSSNRTCLENDLGEALLAVLLLVDNGDVSRDNISEALDFKIKRVSAWLHEPHKMPKESLFYGM